MTATFCESFVGGDCGSCSNDNQSLVEEIEEPALRMRYRRGILLESEPASHLEVVDISLAKDKLRQGGAWVREI